MSALASGEALDEERVIALRQALLGWFEIHQRELPWRQTQDPYAIWISEIMLQQTQVITVKDYFERWMARFPDVEALAEAPLQDVLDIWAGLGYYRRARFIHKAAAQLVAQQDSALPRTVAELKKIPGIGPYTAGAIASIAFGEVAPLVDGNVERVFARLFAIPGDPKVRANQKQFWAIAGQLVDPLAPGDFNQSLMELGATICTPKKPACLLCPVREHCQAFAQGNPLDYPAKVKRAKAREVDVVTLILLDPHAGEPAVLLARRPEQGLLAGLLEFPTLRDPVARAQLAPAHDWLPVLRAMLPGLGITLPMERDQLSALEPAEHTFSHLKMRFHIFLMQAARARISLDVQQHAGLEWVALSSLPDAALSGAQRKVEAVLMQHLRQGGLDAGDSL